MVSCFFCIFAKGILLYVCNQFVNFIMHKLIVLFVTVISVALLSGGCYDKRTRDPFMLWSPVSAPFDSVVRSLELAYAFDQPHDKVLKLTRQLAKIAAADTANDVMQGRVHFWKARYHYRFTPYTEERDNATAREIQLAREAYADTTQHPYDMFRLRYLAQRQANRNIENAYFHNMEILRQGRFFGDSLTVAGTLNNIGLIHLNLGDSTSALNYFKRTCAIFKALGMKDWEKRILLSVAQANGGARSSSSDSIMRELLGYSLERRDTLFALIILHNLYSNDNDISHLRMALALTQEKPSFANSTAYYRAMIANDMFSHGDAIDSAITLAHQAVDGMETTIMPEYEAAILHTYSMALRREGRVDSALWYLDRYVAISDSVARQNTDMEMLKKLAQQRINDSANQALRKSMRERTLFFIIILVVVVLAMSVLMLVLRRHNNLKVSKMSSDLALTRNKLQLAASLAVVQDNESTIDHTLRTIRQMMDEGKISHADGLNVCSALKAQLTNHDELEAFQKVYESIHPNFTSRLLNDCPGLSENLLKLATYIAMQMDNKQIARVMRIEYKSVITARYRLRTRLGLAKEESLEAHLRRYADS